MPFEMIDDALAATARTPRRVRLLPARVVVYLLLAGCLFADCGDPHRYPAADLVGLYHQRWEIEVAYLELRSTIPGVAADLPDR